MSTILSAASRVVSLNDLVARCAEHRARSQRVVFTNGCFDILHRGHAEYLEAAAAVGDVLVVGVNSDRSVRGLKDSGRPVVPQEDRAALIASLRAVDYATIFDAPTPLDLIQMLRPDVLVKGGDYNPDAVSGPTYIVGSEFVRSYGGTVMVIPLVAGRSTTSVIDRVVAAYGAGASSQNSRAGD